MRETIVILLLLAGTEEDGGVEYVRLLGGAGSIQIGLVLAAVCLIVAAQASFELRNLSA